MADNEKKIILITGANSGVGFAATEVLLSDPNNHIIMGSRSLEKGTAALKDIQAKQLPGSVSSILVDISSRASIIKAAADVQQQFGRLDVLVNNAGMYNPREEIEKQLYDSFIVNMLGPALMTEEFKPLLLKSKERYILYISSTLGSLNMSSNAVDPVVCLGYRTSKAALNMCAIENYKELKSQGFKVFAVCPGLVDSNLRGPSLEQRTAGGKAGDPMVSGNTIKSIIDGKRDSDAGLFVHKDGVHDW